MRIFNDIDIKGTYPNGTTLSKCMQHGRGLAGLAESLRQEIAAVYKMGKDIAGSTTFGWFGADGGLRGFSKASWNRKDVFFIYIYNDYFIACFI